ncbi:MAG TPA: Smr/MutS family protein [Rhodocyclaceae bacterium]|nr:Smr/MutS family protein [Rhodocyclaceae bacterium]
MANNKWLSIADLKQRLRTQVKKQKSDIVPLDDAQLFQQAVAGSIVMPANNRARLQSPPPPPVPRPKDPTLADAPIEQKSDANDLPAAWFEDSNTTSRTSEQALLAAALKGVTRIATDKVMPDIPRPHPVPRQSELDERAALAESIYAPTPLELHMEGGDELIYLRDTLPRNVLRDLRRGRWVVEAELDLHGANRDQARDLLADFLAHCRKNEIRCVRIVHGKGLGSPGKEPVLKKLVAGWLMNYDDVLAYAQARVHDGGAGALLVLLRAARR